jgi:hypothetical protein
MKRSFIPVGESFARWNKEPGYAAAYGALEGEFALASSLIKARGEAGIRASSPVSWPAQCQPGIA